MRVAVVMDPIERIAWYKDTTLGMCLLAQQYGWEVDYLPATGLESINGKPTGASARLEVFADSPDFYRLGKFKRKQLTEFDLILMRQDPPVTQRYTYHLMLLQQAVEQGVLVANNPLALLTRNEKLGIHAFPDYTVPTLVSSDKESLHAFIKQHQNVIIKPLDGMGGRGVFHLQPGDDNTNVVIETLSEEGAQLIMAQLYVPEVRQGDKRIFLFDGEPWPWCLARIPQANEARANLAAGGKGETRALSARDREIAETVGARLRGKGLYFVGLDVIGDYLTEVNITSPTGALEMLRDTGSNPLEKLFCLLENERNSG